MSVLRKLSQCTCSSCAIVSYYFRDTKDGAISCQRGKSTEDETDDKNEGLVADGQSENYKKIDDAEDDASDGGPVDASDEDSDQVEDCDKDNELQEMLKN